MLKKSIPALAFLTAGMQAPAVAAAPEVLVSLKPIHSLVAGVMGNAEPPAQLLLPATASPHLYQMRPSDARALQNADLVIWVGEALETFLVRPIATIGNDALSLELSELPGVHLLPTREGGIWEHEDEDHGDEEDGHDHEHGDEDHGHDEEDDHGDEDHGDEDHGHDHGDEEDDHGDEDHGDEDHGHDHGDEEDDHGDEDHGDDEGHGDEDHGHDHEHGEFDMHLWMDPANARRIVEAAAEALSRIDPGNREVWQDNAAQMVVRINAKEEELRGRLALVQDQPFVVFHDAYGYFEQAFGLRGFGAIAVDPSRPTGARRIAELRRALTEGGVACVFTEPQFEPDLVHTLIEGTDVRTATLDPLGSSLEAGPDAWFGMMEDLARAFESCLQAN